MTTRFIQKSKKKKPDCDLDKAIKCIYLYLIDYQIDNFNFNYEDNLEYNPNLRTKTEQINTPDLKKKLLLLSILTFLNPCQAVANYENIMENLKIHNLNLYNEIVKYLNIEKTPWLSIVFCSLILNQNTNNNCNLSLIKQSIDSFYTKIDNNDIFTSKEFKTFSTKIKEEPKKPQETPLPQTTFDPEVLKVANKAATEEAAKKAKSQYLQEHYPTQIAFISDKEKELQAMETQIATIRSSSIDSIKKLIADNQQPSPNGARRGFLKEGQITQALQTLASYEKRLITMSQQKDELKRQLNSYNTTLDQIYDYDQQLNGILQGLQSTPGAQVLVPSANESVETAGEPGAGNPEGERAGGSKRKRSESSTRRTTTIKKSSLKRIYKNKK